MTEVVPTVDDLTGRAFVSTSVRGRQLVDGSVLHLSFHEDRMAARAGCNSMGGPYRLEEGHLAWVGAVISTMMACSEELMDQDRWIAELLGAGVAVRSEGGGLVLRTEGLTVHLEDEASWADQDRSDETSATTTVEAVTPSLGALVEQNVWVVEEIDGGIEPPAGFPPPTMSFDADGSVKVFTGCNQARGSFEVGEGTVSFGPLRLTRMACPPPMVAIEPAVLAVLDGSAEAAWDGDALVLDGREGRLRLRPG